MHALNQLPVDVQEDGQVNVCQIVGERDFELLNRETIGSAAVRNGSVRGGENALETLSPCQPRLR